MPRMRPLRGGEAEVDAALDAGDGAEGAVVENVGGLGGPGGNGALARGDEEAAFAVEVVLGAEEGECALGGGVVEGAFGLDEVDFDGVDALDGGGTLLRYLLTLTLRLPTGCCLGLFGAPASRTLEDDWLLRDFEHRTLNFQLRISSAAWNFGHSRLDVRARSGAPVSGAGLWEDRA